MFDDNTYTFFNLYIICNMHSVLWLFSGVFVLIVHFYWASVRSLHSSINLGADIMFHTIHPFMSRWVRSGLPTAGQSRRYLRHQWERGQKMQMSITTNNYSLKPLITMLSSINIYITLCSSIPFLFKLYFFLMSMLTSNFYRSYHIFTFPLKPTCYGVYVSCY